MLFRSEVRVERLHEITDEGAVAEGIQRGADGRWDGAAREAYASLWDGINGKRAAWDSNPWIWVVSFTRDARETHAPAVDYAIANGGQVPPREADR